MISYDTMPFEMMISRLFARNSAALNDIFTEFSHTLGREKHIHMYIYVVLYIYIYM